MVHLRDSFFVVKVTAYDRFGSGEMSCHKTTIFYDLDHFKGNEALPVECRHWYIKLISRAQSSNINNKSTDKVQDTYIANISRTSARRCLQSMISRLGTWCRPSCSARTRKLARIKRWGENGHGAVSAWSSCMLFVADYNCNICSSSLHRFLGCFIFACCLLYLCLWVKLY